MRWGLIAAVVAATLVAGCSAAPSAPAARNAARKAALEPADPRSVATTRAPDYADPARWLSLPTTGTKPVDVFYLYPSAYQRRTAGDAMVGAVDDPGMLVAAGGMFARQATAFETVGNVYAPYYRQADIASRMVLSPSEQEAIIAGQPTADALAAFDYYIHNYNGGRPYILAGHSLGSNVLANLLATYMRAHPDVYERMVVAYVIGYSVTPGYLSTNPHVCFAAGADDTGVVVSYNTEAPTVGGTNPVTVPGGLASNPITWTRTEATATADRSRGSIRLHPDGTPVTGPDGEPLLVRGMADARVDTARGVVICSSVDVIVFSPGTNGFVPKGVYHTFDYPFYYFDLRANAADRVAAFRSRD